MRSHFVSGLRAFFVIVPLSVSVTAALAACGAASAEPTDGGGSGSVDASPPPVADAGADGKGDLSFIPTLVLVNGLVGGGKLAYGDVRVCVDGVSNPIPDAVAMPMSSYPGVARGTGVDLGRTPALVTLRVFHASDLQMDAAWAKVRVSCDSFAASYPPTSIKVTLGGPTLAV
ncbi:MAG TPA: hypothetical protein VF316_10955, partial [Polyangiaceae bacterium]